MLKPFILVIAAGATIGLMLPSSRPAAAPVAAAPGGEAVETVLEREENGHFYVHAYVNGELVRFLVDTGASSVALTMADAERLGIKFKQSQFEVVGTGASGPVRGKDVMIDSVEIDGKKVAPVQGAVIEGLDISLRGQAYLSRISGVEMSGGHMILR
ncbi:MAG TPA: TIGR02281 family clan AA aspartic protease [Allosphingosinicella sp.]|jgi:aspartyl protease family protein